MARKRYKHPFVNGQLVTDTELGDTFVFSDRTDGHRAQTAGAKMRPATPQEVEKYRAKEQTQLN